MEQYNEIVLKNVLKLFIYSQMRLILIPYLPVLYGMSLGPTTPVLVHLVRPATPDTEAGVLVSHCPTVGKFWGRQPGAPESVVALRALAWPAPALLLSFGGLEGE